MGNNGSLGEVLSNLYKGVVSLLTTGSWHVKEAADQARSAEMILDQVDEAIEQDAQITLDHVDDALTSWNILKARAERLRKQRNDWESKAERAAQETAKYAEGTPDRQKWEGLTKQALVEATKAEDLLTPLDQAIEEARPQVEEALKVVDLVGMSKETALSERDRLEIAGATAQAKQNLATAKRSGDAGRAQELLKEATAKIDELTAKTAADEAIAEHLPVSPSDVEGEIGALSRNDRVNTAFNELMAKTAAKPAEPVTK